MAMTAGSNAGQSYSEINMTPLIDVMLSCFSRSRRGCGAKRAINVRNVRRNSNVPQFAKL